MKFKTSYLASLQKLEEDSYLLGYGTFQDEISKVKAEKIYKILNYTKIERTEKEIKKFLEKNKIEMSLTDYLLIHKQLTVTESLFLKTEAPEFKSFLFLESIFDNVEKIIKNFRKTNFYIIGCGGIGNNISYAIASYMPKKIVLVDGDIIASSNLNQQFLFDERCVGKPKAEILTEKLRARFKEVEIEYHNEFLNEKLLEKIINSEEKNIFLISGDEGKVLEIGMKMAVKTKSPLLNIGYLNDISVIGPFYIPDLSAYPFCSNIGASENNENSFRIDSYSPPSSYINNTLATNMVLIDILYFLKEEYDKITSLNKRVGIECKNFIKQEILVAKAGKCEICGGRNEDNK